jgi:hypothetical protein
MAALLVITVGALLFVGAIAAAAWLIHGVFSEIVG